MLTLGIRRTSGILALTIAVAIGVLAAQPEANGAPPAGKKGDITVTIDPAQARVGQSQQHLIEVANSRSSSNSIGSVQVVVPAAFGNVQIGDVIEPAGFVARVATCSSDSPAGCGAPGSTLIEVSTPSDGGADKVLPGQSLTFAVTATALFKGSFTWSTDAKNSASWSTGRVLSQQGSDPVVRVLGAPAQLSFSAAPPSPITAGQAFATTVAVLDAQGDPTSSDAEITLTASGLGGNTVTDAVDGHAAFSGLTLVQAGSISVVASSPGLSSATSTVVVRPGPPAEVTVAAPACPSAAPDCTFGAGDPVPAGGAFAALVSVVDAYGNVVDTPQSVTITRAATASEPAESTTHSGSDGNLPVELVAPATPGGYHFTVTSGSLPPTSFDLDVEAGRAVVLTIDAVTPQNGQVLLAKDQPFDVAVTARDAYGNPSEFTGTVTLSASGGTGPALGTLSAPAMTFDGTSAETATGLVYDGYGNSITLTASAPGLIDGTQLLNINLFATTKHATPGQALTVGLSNCTSATPEVPVCTSMVLSHGAVGPVTVAQGECDPFTPCRAGSQNEALLFDGLADLTDGDQGLYSRRDPAMIVLRCDKTLCGGAGVRGFPLLFQETGWAATRFEEAPPCPAKGRIGAGQTFCHDYRQNNRDNAGDLIAYLLFMNDAKATFK